MMYPCVFIVYDIETGGLMSQNIDKKTGEAYINPILEFACIGLDQDMKELFRYETFVKPYKGKNGEESRVEQGALQANGIDMNQVIEKGIEIKDLYTKLLEIFKISKRGRFAKPILVGHNIGNFDNPFIEYVFDMFEDREKGKSAMWKYVDSFFYDTCMMARTKWGNKEQLQNFQLGTCCSYIGAELVNAHRAMNDVEGNTKLFYKLLSDLRVEGSVEKKVEETKTVKNYRKTFQF